MYGAHVAVALGRVQGPLSSSAICKLKGELRIFCGTSIVILKVVFRVPKSLDDAG